MTAEELFDAVIQSDDFTRKWRSRFLRSVMSDGHIGHDADEIVGEASTNTFFRREKILRDFDRDWEGSEIAGLDKMRAVVFGYFRMAVREQKSRHRLKRRRYVPIGDPEWDKEDNAGRVFSHQRMSVPPEQEDAVFYKQVLDRISWLPSDERAVISGIFDRATLRELCDEMGVSGADAMNRYLSGVKRLRKMAEPPA